MVPSKCRDPARGPAQSHPKGPPGSPVSFSSVFPQPGSRVGQKLVTATSERTEDKQPFSARNCHPLPGFLLARKIMNYHHLSSLSSSLLSTRTTVHVHLPHPTCCVGTARPRRVTRDGVERSNGSRSAQLSPSGAQSGVLISFYQAPAVPCWALHVCYSSGLVGDRGAPRLRRRTWRAGKGQARGEVCLVLRG